MVFHEDIGELFDKRFVEAEDATVLVDEPIQSRGQLFLRDRWGGGYRHVRHPP